LLPFKDRVLLLRVNGEQLLAALENGVSQFDEHAGRFPIVSVCRSPSIPGVRSATAC
jgi:hypothetical protein